MADSYDHGTLKATVYVAGVTLLWVVVLNAGLVVGTAAYPNWLPRQFMGVDFLADNRQRAEAVTALARDGQLGDSDAFVVILGLSSASEGVTVTDLARRLSGGTRVLGLSGGGRNILDIKRYAEPLLDGSSRPALTVFAINPFHLMDTPPASEALLDNLGGRETIDQLRGYWLVDRRQDVKYAVDAGIDHFRSALFGFFDVRLSGGVDPWREIVRMGLPQATHEAQWQSKVQSYGERGYYDLDNYLRSRVQIETFHHLVTRFQRRGTQVVVVFMPEHSRLRARIPKAGVEAVLGSLSDRFGDRAPEVIDLRGAIPDAGFTDISHMNGDGRRLFGPILAEVLEN